MMDQSRLRLLFAAGSLACFQLFAHAATAQQANNTGLDRRALRFSSAVSPSPRPTETTAVPATATLYNTARSGVRRTPAGQALARPQFTVAADVPVGYTNNASSSEEEEDDVYVAPTASLGVELDLGPTGGRLAVGAGIAAERFKDNSELDADYLQGSALYQLSLGGLDLQLSYSPVGAYDTGFEDRSILLHPLAIAASHAFGFGGMNPGATSEAEQRSVIAPTFALQRTLTDPSDFDSTQFSLGLPTTTAITQSVSFDLEPNAAVIWYDDFFEDELGESRRDLVLGITAAVSWSPLANGALTLIGSAAVEQNYSTIEGGDYSRLDLVPTVSAKLTF